MSDLERLVALIFDEIDNAKRGHIEGNNQARIKALDLAERVAHDINPD